MKVVALDFLEELVSTLMTEVDVSRFDSVIDVIVENNAARRDLNYLAVLFDLLLRLPVERSAD